MEQYLVKRFSDIFGKLKITPSRDLLWFDAIQKAKELENELGKEFIENDNENGCKNDNKMSTHRINI